MPHGADHWHQLQVWHWWRRWKRIEALLWALEVTLVREALVRGHGEEAPEDPAEEGL